MAAPAPLTPPPTTRRGPSIRRLLLGVNAVILLVPVLAVVLLRIYDAHLLEQTERRLIAESVIIGEAWRSAWLAAQQIDPALAPDFAPPNRRDDTFFPIEPVIDITAPPARFEPPPAPRRAKVTPAAATAGRAIQPLLQRAKRINLTGVRVLDAQGCVVASTAPEALDLCLADTPEVKVALSGRYHAVARPRYSDEPRPSPTAISRGGTLRVFTATPLHSDGRIIGVVRMSRTTIEPLRALWKYRTTLAWALLACVGLAVALSLFLTRTITRPVRAIRDAAQAIARGEPRQPLRGRGRVPAEVHALSEALDRMTAQLADRAAYVADFAANVSHELKTPIASVRGATELLRDAWDSMGDAQRDRFLGNIEADALRMDRLVTDLLRLARVENRPAGGPVDGREGATPAGEALAALLARYPADRLAVQIEPGAAAAPVSLGPDALQGMVGNLIDNALVHGGDGVVAVTAARRGGQLEVTVRDHGGGISAANQARIFDRFFTTRRDRGGTGLGLPLVRAIARAHGGDASLVRTGPDGTTFSVGWAVAADPTLSERT